MAEPKPAAVADVVIVNWNAADLVVECVRSVQQFGRAVGRIIVVDNGSSDDSVARLAEIHGIVLVRSDQNLGFAKACNLGASKADAPYVLFFNPDARLIDDSLSDLLAWMETPAAARVGVAGGRLIGDDGHTQPSCSNFTDATTYLGQAIGLAGRMPRLFTPHFAQIDYTCSQPVDQVMGAYFLVRTDLYRSLGGMDERFFVYFEEVDFCLRARQAGWVTYYRADAVAYHKGGGVSEQVKATRLFYTLRSRLLYADKHFAASRFWATLFVTLALEPVSRIGRAVLRRSPAEAAETVQAYRMLARDAAAIRRNMRDYGRPVCSGCRLVARPPHFETENRMSNVDLKTVEGFGQEWDAYDQTELDEAERRAYFDKYFGIFPFDILPKGAIGVDVGCGSGRWADLVADKVGHLHCVDPAPAALAVARRRLARHDNVEFHVATSDTMLFAPDSLDFGYSLGVLHHIPDTEAAMRDCVKVLKPGSPFLVYLYYRFDNRPAWFAAAWRASDGVRRVLSRMPFGVRKAATTGIAALVYWPLARTARLLQRVGTNATSFPLSFYRDASFYTMRTDALDRFGTRLEQRFTRREIEQMMTACGLDRIRFSDGDPYWVACGIKR